MSRIGKVDRAIIEYLIDAEASAVGAARSYAGGGQSAFIVLGVSRALDMGYRGLPMPLRYIPQSKYNEWESQQRKNHSVAQSIRRSLRKLKRDGIITTFAARFLSDEPEPDRNKTWCLTEIYADAVFGANLKV
jgi:hypothetical protein